MPSYRPLAVNQGIEAGRFLGKRSRFSLFFGDTGSVALKETQQLVEENFEKTLQKLHHINIKMIQEYVSFLFISSQHGRSSFLLGNERRLQATNRSRACGELGLVE